MVLAQFDFLHKDILGANVTTLY